eukprot:CAMPEP_0171590748 /NCGR_PEP_ID=MMETSP0961-20121227/15734_1 /TAXON_ID=87120 /ORGANISM="Aurantiochytrium limacinum, Strain ATCCMYA-1381" /LENGTH=785 /DNA_ID=CAMNT_0012150507 /DNA_START=804 /DNA_END=3159 /DNA_ORIENTATION=+
MSCAADVETALAELQNGATELRIEADIDDESMSSLADAMLASGKIKYMHFGNCNIGNAGASILAEALFEICSLEVLILENNLIGNEGTGALAASLRENQSLRILDLKSNKIVAEGCMALGEALRNNTVLETLILCNNEIGADSCFALADTLRESKSLEFLDLSGCNIGSEGALALAEGLRVNQSLRTLCLQDCNVGDEGSCAIAGALLENRFLQTLSLASNNIGVEGAVELATLLQDNDTSQVYYLQHNHIGNEGARVFASALRGNASTLKVLNLIDTNIDAEGVLALADAVELNLSLQTLSLDVDIPDDLALRIDAHFEEIRQEVSDFGQYALDALSRDKSATWARVKLMVVGKCNSGKTSTIRTLLGQPYVPEYIPTNGVQTQLVRAQDWITQADIVSSDLSRLLSDRKYRHKTLLRQRSSRIRDSVKSAVSLRRSSSESTTLEEGSSIASSSESTLQLTTEYLSTLYDAEARLQAQKQTRKLQEEVSLMIWEYGGTKEFFPLHRLFFSSGGLYLLVFDMRELYGKALLEDVIDMEELDHLDDQDTALEAIYLQLYFIRTQASRATVVLVGTHLDTISDQKYHRAIERTLMPAISSEPSLKIITNRKERLSFFPIDNTNRVDLSHCYALRSCLASTAALQSIVKEKISLRWSLCLHEMYKTDRNFLSEEHVFSIATTQCGVPHRAVRKMLAHMHDRGALVYFPGSAELRRLVVLRTPALLNILSKAMQSADEFDELSNTIIEGDSSYIHALLGAIKAWEGLTNATAYFLQQCGYQSANPKGSN